MALKAYADGKLFAESVGEHPRILALHGWGRRGADFRSALAGLSYLAPDLPGFGASPPPQQVMGSEGYAAAVEPLLGDLSGRSVLVGHSFGGRVALRLATSRPELFAGLLLTGAPLLRGAVSQPSLRYRIGRWAGRAGLISSAALERLRQRHGSVDYRTAQGVMRGVLVSTTNESYDDELEALRLPTILLWGENDPEVSVDVARTIGRRIEGAEIQVLAGVGHQVPIEAPQALRESVEKLLIA
jgi:pimeloyl-ACP methyl ester carboxylesterase